MTYKNICRNSRCSGFTLLELMVVVIIIGILTSLALPQYEKAVEKSRAAEAMTLGKAIVESQNRSLNAFPNDSVATKSALDIRLDNGTWTSDGVYTTDNFTYTLGESGVTMERTNGKYTLFMGNAEAQMANTCSGTICSAMKGLGFGNAAD